MKQDEDPPGKKSDPKPWPMIWVVIAILTYILLQTLYILWND